MPRIPYGTEYTVRVSGSKWKSVICDNCGCEYYYQIKHQAGGSATNVLWLNKQEAINSAEKNAYKNLEEFLEIATRDYSCPDCGFYQTEKIRAMERDIWQPAIVLGVIVFLIVFWIVFVKTASSSTALLCALVLGLLTVFIPLRKLTNFNPNSDAQVRINQQFSETYPVLRKSELESWIQVVSATG